MLPLRVVHVEKKSQLPHFSLRYRKIRQLLGLLENPRLSARGYARLAELMEEFGPELEAILKRWSVHERCCMDVSCRCKVSEEGRLVEDQPHQDEDLNGDEWLYRSTRYSC